MGNLRELSILQEGVDRFFGDLLPTAPKSFHRSFTLLTTVDRDKIRAHYQDGIVEITLPRTEEVTSHSIPVKVN